MSEPSRNPISVLVVDDEADVREILAQFVVHAGCEAMTCHSGESAMAELERKTYQIVVSDIKMRGIDGVELLRRVKEKWPGTEFILVTGNATIDAAIEALRHGAYDFLLKPVRMEKIVSTVRRCRERIEFARENSELRLVVDRLKELNSRKEKFVAVANHELRTPISVAAGMISKLKKKSGELSPELADLVLKADEAFGRLKEVVREIGELATARNFEQWVRLRPCSFMQIASDVEKSLAECGQNRDLELGYSCLVGGDFEVMADPAKVARAVGALIQNAVKFTPDGKSVHVRIEPGDGFMLFTVADQGIGLPRGEEEKIFDLFYTAGSELEHHSSDHEFMGSGLGVGLSLSKIIANAHGGDVTYSPNEGGGSVFTLSIKV